MNVLGSRAIGWSRGAVRQSDEGPITRHSVRLKRSGAAQVSTLDDHRVMIVDCETTVLSLLADHRIVELSVIRLGQERFVNELANLLKPERDISVGRPRSPRGGCRSAPLGSKDVPGVIALAPWRLG